MTAHKYKKIWQRRNSGSFFLRFNKIPHMKANSGAQLPPRLKEPIQCNNLYSSRNKASDSSLEGGVGGRDKHASLY